MPRVNLDQLGYNGIPSMVLKSCRFALVWSRRRRSDFLPIVLLAVGVLTVCVSDSSAVSCPRVQPVVLQDAPSQEPGPPPPAEVPEPSEEDTAPPPMVDSEHPPAEVEAAVASVTSPDPEAVAQALALELKPQDAAGENAGLTSLELLGDLDGDGVPELALRWAGLATSPPAGPDATEDSQGGEAEEVSSARPVWVFYLLAWDGTRWNPARLMETESPFTVQVQPIFSRTSRDVVTIVQEGANAVPYPVIFQFKDHTATLMWDSRADDSRYQGLAQGEIEFHDLNGDGVTELIVTGRADPGLLVFSKQGQRGFAARVVLSWDGSAFVPGKTEYAGNQDYTLYRFISALHLHDYRAAYALIDPATFLNTKEPTLASFQKQIEASWPEFALDSIFEAREPSPGADNDFSFALAFEDKNYLYRPTFGPGPKFLLTGLERTEEK